ncbi:hypothetical protein FQA39_LY04234 [Lamprigera yunnana]|nr:hypothetical protein FQA39_LY04234 [Lamprigera yunnana]
MSVEPKTLDIEVNVNSSTPKRTIKPRSRRSQKRTHRQRANIATDASSVSGKPMNASPHSTLLIDNLTDTDASIKNAEGKNKHSSDHSSDKTAGSAVIDQTKMLKNQELQIEALTQQVNSLKEIININKDMLEIRNVEVQQLNDKVHCMEIKFDAAKERNQAVNMKLEKMVVLNATLKEEYKKQLNLLSGLQKRYQEHITICKNQFCSKISASEPTSETQAAENKSAEEISAVAFVAALVLTPAYPAEEKKAVEDVKVAEPNKKQDKRGLFDLGYGHASDFGSFDLSHDSGSEFSGFDSGFGDDHKSIKTFTIEKTVKVPVPAPYPVTVEKKVPIPVPVKVPVPVIKHYPVEVPKPYPVTVEKFVPYPVEKAVPYPVKVPVKVFVPHPVAVPVEKPVPYTVHKPVPYPVKVPVVVEKKVPIYIKEHKHESFDSFSHGFDFHH